MRSFSWIAGLWIVLLHHSLLAQPSDLRFRHLSIEDGLSQSTVHAIIQDRDGFMWFGTQDGLNRFDGYTFTVFKHHLADSTSLSDNEVRVLHQDRAGTLWVGTFGGGLNRLNAARTAFTRYRHDPAIPGSLCDDQVRVIHEDQNGWLWIGTEHGLDRLDPTTNQFIHIPIQPDSTKAGILAIDTDHEGTLWFGTDDGLGRYDTGTGHVTLFHHSQADPSSLSPGAVWAIREDATHHLWIGTDHGLDLLNRATGQFEHRRHDSDDPHSLGHDSIWTLFVDGQGVLWIGTYGGGVNRFDGERFLHYRHVPADPSSLSSNRIRALYEDRSGVLWVGSLDGIDYTNRAGERFGRYHHRTGDPHSVSDGSVWAFQEDADGQIWIGTDEGLDRFNPETGVMAHYRHDATSPNSLSDNRVWALAWSAPGMLWIGTDSGLDRLDLATERFTHYRHETGNPNSLAADRAWALLADSSGTLWVGTDGGGLDRLDPQTGRVTHHRHDNAVPNSLSENRIRTLFRDRDGTLWVGTYGKGLNRFDAEGRRFIHYRHDELRPQSLSSDRIRALYQDEAGTRWIGTDGGGLNSLSAAPDPDAATAVFDHFTEEQGLPNSTVYGILPDIVGSLWLSTNKGLARFSLSTRSVTNYDVNDGLQSNEFNGGAALRSRAGKFYFGGISGFNAFDPEQIVPDPYVPPVVFTGFKIYNREMTFDVSINTVKTINLTYRDDLISFEFAALDFRAPEKNRYAYKLEGFNREWVNLGNKRDITFTNLDPGRYDLHVRGTNSDGVWNETGATLHLVISPPFWKQWWVQLLGLITLGGLLWQGHRSRTHRIELHNRELQAEISIRRTVENERESFVHELESRNAELERFTYTVSHDLKSPLVTIKGFLGLLEKDLAADDDEHLKRDIYHINTAADRMQRLLSELLELSRTGRAMNPPEVIPLSDLAHEAFEQIQGEIASSQVKVNISPDMPAVFGDRVRLREVFQNLIENAVKFRGSQAQPTVDIDAHNEGGEVICSVRDNGIGIELRYQEKVFGLFERLDADTDGTGIGLALVKRIIEVHHGRIWIESEGQDRGTTFLFSLPRDTNGTSPKD